MKKLLALLLALVMVLSLVACGEEEETTRKRRRSSADDETTEITEETEEVTEEVTEDIPQETEEVTEEVTVEETVEVTEPVEEEPPVEGVIYNGCYENEYFGIGFEPDSGWQYATDSEITSQYGYPTTIEDAGTVGVFCDMMAANPSSASTGIAANVLLVIQEENFLSRGMTDEEYAESAAQSGVASLEAAGATNIEWEIVEVEVAGDEHVALVFTSSIYGVSVCQVMAIVREGDYIIAPTITATSLDYCGEILEYFYSL